MTSSERLASERFIHWNRTPTTRFIRAVFAGAGTIPSEYSLGDAYVYGHTMDSKGNCIRLFYCDLTQENDGLFEYRPDSKRRDAEAGSPVVRLTQPLQPMSAEHSPDSLRAQEALIRITALDHWTAYHSRERERKRLEAVELERANEDATAKALAEQAAKAAAIKAQFELDLERAIKPRPKPQPHWFLRLLGSK